MLAQAAAPTNFVLQHKCRRWESLISVAVQYLADTTAIRVLNNLTTDHSLRSREYVYVPGGTFYLPIYALAADPCMPSAAACLVFKQAHSLCAVPKEHIAGRAARFTYDSIVDRDLIVLADDVASLPEPPKQSQKSQEERAADAIQKMSNLLGKSELPLIALLLYHEIVIYSQAPSRLVCIAPALI